jgi:Ulp1 family protease
VLASHERSKLELAGHDLKTLAPGQWLNDECMNMYIALLQVRARGVS